MDERYMKTFSKVYKIGIQTMLNVVDSPLKSIKKEKKRKGKLTHLPRQTS